CVDARCVECSETAHCTSERPYCIAGSCTGRDCATSGECAEGTPICDRGLCVACAEDAECLEGACRTDGSCGGCRTDDDCDAGFCAAGGSCEAAFGGRVIFVVDVSGSMGICAPREGGSGGGPCDSDADGT